MSYEIPGDMDALINFAPTEGHAPVQGGFFELRAMFTRDYVEESNTEIVVEEVTRIVNNTIIREVQMTKHTNTLTFVSFGVVAICGFIVLYVCLTYQAPREAVIEAVRRISSVKEPKGLRHSELPQDSIVSDSV